MGHLAAVADLRRDGASQLVTVQIPAYTTCTPQTHHTARLPSMDTHAHATHATHDQRSERRARVCIISAESTRIAHMHMQTEQEAAAHHVSTCRQSEQRQDSDSQISHLAAVANLPRDGATQLVIAQGPGRIHTNNISHMAHSHMPSWKGMRPTTHNTVSNESCHMLDGRVPENLL